MVFLMPVSYHSSRSSWCLSCPSAFFPFMFPAKMRQLDRQTHATAICSGWMPSVFSPNIEMHRNTTPTASSTKMIALYIFFFHMV